MTFFDATTNPFRGIIPNPEALPSDAAQFQTTLSKALAAWKAEDYLVVWLEVPIAKSALIPIAVDAGFVFHHSGEDYLMLTHQLEPGAFIPAYSTHYIGAGGVVINDNDEILVVSEKFRRNKDNPSYKLPGGALHQGEHIQEAVAREVFEETGVKANFERIVCFRHWHGYRYGKSDIYFICRLSPVTQAISMQEDEIEDCLWMPVAEYLASDYVHHFNKLIVKAALDSPGVVPTAIEGYQNPESHEFFFPE
ncbi:MAG: NUDIX domain-containing protein [Chloroflexota bacterium]